MAMIDLILNQVNKQRFNAASNKWIRGGCLYKDNNKQLSESDTTKQLDWNIISNQLNRKKLNESTLANRIVDVGARLFKKDYK